MTEPVDATDALSREVRLHVFGKAADTGQVPQPPEIAAALGRSQSEVEEALKGLAAGKVLILAPNDGNIWAANPFRGMGQECHGKRPLFRLVGLKRIVCEIALLQRSSLR